MSATPRIELASQAEREMEAVAGCGMGSGTFPSKATGCSS